MTSLPPFPELWKETWQRFGANNNLMLSIGAIAAAPLVALSFFRIERTLSSIIIMGSLYLLAALWSSLASMAIYASAAHPEIRTIKDAFRLGRTRWLAFATTQLLEGIAVLLPAILLFAVLIFVSLPSVRAVGVDNIEKVNGPLLLTIGALIIAGMIALSFWAYRLTFSGFIVFSENKKNLSALRSSFALTTGRTMELWRRFFVFGLCILAMSIGITIIANISTASFDVHSQAFKVMDSMFGLLQNMILIPLETLFVAVLYNALRAKDQPTIQA